MIKYKSRWFEITKEEVLRETAKTVVLVHTNHQGKSEEVRNLKRTEWDNWHDSWEEAKEFLVKTKRLRLLIDTHAGCRKLIS